MRATKKKITHSPGIINKKTTGNGPFFQAKPGLAPAAKATGGISSYVGSLSSKGSSLPESSKNFFESRFGRDFSSVKIHTDIEAAKSAQSINALAYTSGNNIVFNQNQFSPESDAGKKLIAHELTHVVQQDDNVIKKTPAVAAPASAYDDEGEPTTGVVIAGSVVGNYVDLTKWYTGRWLTLESILSDLKKGRIKPPGGLEDMAWTAKARRDRFEKLKNAEVSDQDIEMTLDWFDSALKLYIQGQNALANAVIDKMLMWRNKIETNQDSVVKLEPRIREEMRIAFSENSESKLSKLKESLDKVNEFGEKQKTAVFEINGAIQSLGEDYQKLNAELEPFKVHEAVDLGSKSIEGIAKIQNTVDKVLVSYDLVHSVYELWGGGRTPLDQGIKGLSVLSKGLSELTTFMSASDPMSFMLTSYISGYLSPGIEKALEAIGPVAEKVEEQSRYWIGFGRLAGVSWVAMPGGKPMFTYIFRVMHASGADTVPHLSNDAFNYFINNIGKFNAGVGGEDKIPFDIWQMLGNRQALLENINQWVFRHRFEVWAMLYGNTKVPDVTPEITMELLSR